jgi:hypothetical protein
MGEVVTPPPKADRTQRSIDAGKAAEGRLDATLIALTPDGILEFFRQMTGASRERLQGYVNQVRDANKRAEIVGKVLAKFQASPKEFDNLEQKERLIRELDDLEKELGPSVAAEVADMKAALTAGGDQKVTENEMNSIFTSLKTIQTHYTDLNAEVMLDVQKLSGQLSQMTSLCSNLLQSLNQTLQTPINNLK